MKILLAYIRDLLWSGKIKTMTANLPDEADGWQVVTVRNVVELQTKLAANRPEVAVVDLQLADWERAVKEVVEAGVPVLAFGSHVKPDILRAARGAGAYRAVPNSVLATKFADLLAARVAPIKPFNEEEITEEL